MPVLILTALDGVNDRVRGLDAGADDYMPKPFELAELEARVRALTRRGMAGGPTLLKHGALTYDQVGRSAQMNGAAIELPAREVSLLEIFLQAPGASSPRTSWWATCASGARKSRATPSRSTCTGCARNSSPAACAS